MANQIAAHRAEFDEIIDQRDIPRNEFDALADATGSPPIAFVSVFVGSILGMILASFALLMGSSWKTVLVLYLAAGPLVALCLIARASRVKK